MARLAPGSTLEPQGFYSTSKSRYRARRFAGKSDILFEVHGRSGRDISAVSEFRRQREVLFAPERRFRVVSVKREGSILHVVVEEIE